MGIFSSIKNAAIEANEEAHGVRLERELRSTNAGLAQLPDNVRPVALMRFLKKRQKLAGQMSNWSHEGCLQVARALQDEARKQHNFNIAESYALWMAGAWIEGSIRSSTRALGVHEHLEGFARVLLEDPDIVNDLRHMT